MGNIDINPTARSVVKLITVVRRIGQPNQVTLEDGTIIEKKDAIWFTPYNWMVKCEDYDDHFVFENPVLNQPSFLCTCGSAAVVTPLAFDLGGGRKYVAPHTRLVCLTHKSSGQHVTSLVDRKVYER